MKIFRRVLLLSVMSAPAFTTWADDFKGRIVDARTGEALIGATLQIMPTHQTATSDNDGVFKFNHLAARNYTLSVSYIGYQRSTITINPSKLDSMVVIKLNENENVLGVATITAQVKRNTENSQVAAQHQSLLVQNGISSQQIAKTQDKDASEVIKRVPGISIIDQKFVMIRGLSQRYNNVWINGAAVPSSEPDSRAFSFDIIPSSQVDNMQIIKSPAPQYPADFSGGFILIDTKDVPNTNSTSISVGGSLNDQTHFRSFYSSKGSNTDFCGFDNGMRSLKGGLNTDLQLTPGGKGIDLLNNGFNNDWTIKKHHTLPDLNFAANINRAHTYESGNLLALLAALNYSNTHRTYANMENAFFGAYDLTHDESVYLHRYTDNQYSNHVRLGAMLNLTFVPAKGGGRYEWKNIFNQLGTNRFTSRQGTDAQSNTIKEAEYFYSSRTTYNTQVAGKHIWDSSRFDWNAGYAYANRHLPDRRRYSLDDQLEQGKIGLTTGNNISREFTQLDEHIASVGMNYKKDFEQKGKFTPQLLAGLYSEYRTRNYNTRSFIYAWDPLSQNLPTGFRYLDLPTQLLQATNYGDTGLYLLDDTKLTNNYSGHHLVSAAYAATNLSLGALNVYAGLRIEHSHMALKSNLSDFEHRTSTRNYTATDLFPSVNTTYKLNEQHQVRLSYGRSINRPEFREISTSVFYDFDLASDVQGNTELKACHIDNIDLRYEWYPAQGDQISLAGFYKHFNDPIEWSYTVTGGTNVCYSFVNAQKSHSLGLELDIRKSLDFIGLNHFTLVFNGSVIKSRVKFNKKSRQANRPMQGQSPYLINLGLFYSNKQWNASLQYNRIGKRLIGVGRNLGSTGDQMVNIPDSYEMPRNAIDLSASVVLGHFDIKLGIRDILAEKICFKQFNEVQLTDGTNKKVEEITRRYHSGRDMNLTISYHF